MGWISAIIIHFILILRRSGRSTVSHPSAPVQQVSRAFKWGKLAIRSLVILSGTGTQEAYIGFAYRSLDSPYRAIMMWPLRMPNPLKILVFCIVQCQCPSALISIAILNTPVHLSQHNKRPPVHFSVPMPTTHLSFVHCLSSMLASQPCRFNLAGDVRLIIGQVNHNSTQNCSVASKSAQVVLQIQVMR